MLFCIDFFLVKFGVELGLGQSVNSILNGFGRKNNGHIVDMVFLNLCRLSMTRLQEEAGVLVS